MNRESIDAAVRALVHARRTRQRLDALPQGARPSTVDDAHAIQRATVEALGDAIAGWKVLSPIDGQIPHGVLLRSRVLESPAELSAADVPMLGVEAEIAFRFDRALPAQAAEFSYEDVAAAVTAFAAIEVVDSRFVDYKGSAVLDRLADCGSNGAFIRGAPQAAWRSLDLSTLRVRLAIDDSVVVDRRGGHASGDPLLPAIALANALRKVSGVHAGQVMTTGTFTGLNYAKPGNTVTVTFEHFAPVTLRFQA